MEKSTEYIQELWGKYLNKTATAADITALFGLLNGTNRDQLLESLQAEMKKQPLIEKLSAEQHQEMLEQIFQVNTLPLQGTSQEENGKSAARVIGFRRRWLQYAAILLLLIGAGTYYFINRQQPSSFVKQQEKKQEPQASPGGNRAVLTLADGSTIMLDSASDGTLANQGNTKIRKLDAGSISYTDAGEGSVDLLYNTIQTPRGGQYQIVLPDGSKVWLNSASSIKFPTAFQTDKRIVEMTGEAYFEIAKDNTRPFRVMVNGTEIEVIGTHFNVNSYPDELSLNTTLLEGKVAVSKGSAKALLSPGQQARLLSSESSFSIIKAVDTEQVVAWKNGNFHFNDAGIAEVMRQLSRWYDIDVTYPKSMPAVRLTGKMQRSLPLAEVLEGLGGMELHFKMEGKKLIVN